VLGLEAVVRSLVVVVGLSRRVDVSSVLLIKSAEVGADMYVYMQLQCL
jgi:hypothetical protein